MRCIAGLLFLMLFSAAACSDVSTSPDPSPLVSEFTPATGAADDGPPNLWGPWNKRVRIAVSDNGLDWTAFDVTVADQADVPTVVTVDGEVLAVFCHLARPG